MSNQQFGTIITAHAQGRLEDFERIIKEIFEEMDANKNGEVDREEVLTKRIQLNAEERGEGVVSSE